MLSSCENNLDIVWFHRSTPIHRKQVFYKKTLHPWKELWFVFSDLKDRFCKKHTCGWGLGQHRVYLHFFFCQRGHEHGQILPGKHMKTEGLTLCTPQVHKVTGACVLVCVASTRTHFGVLTSSELSTASIAWQYRYCLSCSDRPSWKRLKRRSPTTKPDRKHGKEAIHMPYKKNNKDLYNSSTAKSPS